MPLEQTAISLQCGFSSDVVGNLISDDDQKRKLAVVVRSGAADLGLGRARLGSAHFISQISILD